MSARVQNITINSNGIHIDGYTIPRESLGPDLQVHAGDTTTFGPKVTLAIHPTTITLESTEPRNSAQ